MNSRRLPAGYQIQNYKIERFLGEGTFGITYKAVDLNLNRPVAIKEFIPNEFSIRSDDGDVEPRNAECENIYRDGLLNYVKEAQALACFKHENIVQVYTFLRHHKTAYIIMEYVEGVTFSEWLRQNPNPAEESLIAIIRPILDGLHEVHEIGLLHRDIKPANIYICNNNRPVLLDFGAVKHSLPEGRTQELSAVILTQGYAPPEQYGKSGQGPWTDVYAVGVCLHLAVTGHKVKDAVERTSHVVNGMPDPQPSLRDVDLRNNYSTHFLNAIEQAIKLNSKDRIQNALSFKNKLINLSNQSTSSQESGTDYQENEQSWF